jgi:hypothetical protein
MLTKILGEPAASIFVLDSEDGGDKLFWNIGEHLSLLHNPEDSNLHGDDGDNLACGWAVAGD